MNIYVGNLAVETTEDQLRKEFTAFGQVLSVSMMNDKYIGSGQARRYGFVEMLSTSEGETAVKGLNGKKLRELAMMVIKALPLSGEQSNRRYRQRN